MRKCEHCQRKLCECGACECPGNEEHALTCDHLESGEDEDDCGCGGMEETSDDEY